LSGGGLEGSIHAPKASKRKRRPSIGEIKGNQKRINVFPYYRNNNNESKKRDSGTSPS